MVISDGGRKYRKAVWEQVIQQALGKRVRNRAVVTIQAFRPDNRRRDLDNLLKAVLDALTAAEVWDDDSQITDLRIYWGPDIGGYLKVNIVDTGENDDGRDQSRTSD
jgi:crossover junction endodeoxyribonuclease RusA